jgi:hypothetical protein
VFPVKLRVKYSNGSVRDFDLPVEIWANGSVFDAVLPAPVAVVGVRLWPDTSVPDWDNSNDTWGDPPPADPVRKVTLK